MDILSSPNPAPKIFLRSIQTATTEARKTIKLYIEKTTAYVNGKRSPKQYSSVDMVYFSTENLVLTEESGSRKLQPKHCGPFKILKKLGNISCKLDLSEPMRCQTIHATFHASLLKNVLSWWVWTHHTTSIAVTLQWWSYWVRSQGYS